MIKRSIGIPRALLYYKYGTFWIKFFDNLGCKIVVSPETNKDIITKGINLAVDESCLSVKIYLGHVDWLSKRVDYIFIPHFEHLYPCEEICVKFMGLNDIVRNIFPSIKIIEYTVDEIGYKKEWLHMIILGTALTYNPVKSVRAYLDATKEYKKEKENRFKSQFRKIENRDKSKPLILIVSHPYTTYDNFLGRPISDFLERQGVDIIYSDIIDNNLARSLSSKIAKDLYWTFHKELIGAVEFYKEYVDGIIFLMTFPCGPDSLMINLCQIKLKDIPSALITLDELQAEVGLRTRLESFIDILKIRIKCKQEE
ncbi:MAG: acyl-CoA dehydratase activase-related protein [bacterium]